jgi:hypothetical protein
MLSDAHGIALEVCKPESARDNHALSVRDPSAGSGQLRSYPLIEFVHRDHE